MKLTELMTRYRNFFLLGLLLVTLYVSSIANSERLGDARETIAIPVVETAADAADPLSAYKAERDRIAEADMAALQALCDQSDLDAATRADAAAQLQALVANREAQLAIEGALLQSALAPCVAVVTGSSVTLVTGVEAPTKSDTARLIALAEAHAGATPADVRIITAK
ncbi:MAG: SpoIIIAH-like family protein [Clostridia bacterium]|nr:SpoIIIAH-like family protein [Clostridia bacterium]